MYDFRGWFVPVFVRVQRAKEEVLYKSQRTLLGCPDGFERAPKNLPSELCTIEKPRRLPRVGGSISDVCPKSGRGNADEPFTLNSGFNHVSIVGTIRIEIVPFGVLEVNPTASIAFLARLYGCLRLFAFLRLLKLR
jgi:hypothetical protein